LLGNQFIESRSRVEVVARIVGIRHW
jgi:hypothetical protein